MNLIYPRTAWPLRLVLAVLVLGLLWFLQGTVPRVFGPYINHILLVAGINVILAVSLTLINGITGQFSLGHAGFMAVGAYSSAYFTVHVGPQIRARSQSEALANIVIILLALLIAAVTAGIAGFLVGLPSLRLRGDYLAIVTLGFGQIIVALITTIKEVGGALGFSDLPGLTNFVWVYITAIVSVLAIRNLANSTLGRSMRAVRDDEIAAQAVGINTTQIKVTAFVVSAMCAGFAGMLQVHLDRLAQTDTFSFTRSVEIVVMVVLGGLGSITGAIITAVLLTVLVEVLRTIAGAFFVGIGLILLATVLSLPRHQAGLREGGAARVQALFRWLRWPTLFLALTLFVYFNPMWRAWMEGRVSALRYIIYALILIVLMLLRPQGLLGRGEFGWHLFRRAQDQSGEQAVGGEFKSSTRTAE
ncbi:MAG TPA: branched-chain amino acid ABC transporter permease [Abditibacteriaceae bacterium]|nr:branched-chain amino acid ABC transporter permease [Abditibacteriaceae bacterium]